MGEVAFRFVCEGSSLLGVLHEPARAGELGVLMFVGGGPQYRVGGHRQLVLWARALAHQGIPVMRFDYRGVGDGGGEFRGFEHVEADTRAAIAEFLRRAPSVQKLILWGECDASSAIMMHAHKEPKVVGISLQNPWARTAEGQAKTYIKHYYLRRLTERSFWQRLLQGKMNPLTAALGFARHGLQAFSRSSSDAAAGPAASSSYVDRMKHGYRAFGGEVLLYMSGRDLIAREFDVLVAADKDWSALMRRKTVRRIDLPLADHTFSSAEMRQSVLESASEWIRSIRAGLSGGR
jgi:exosortase A-associated hydrolase 1